MNRKPGTINVLMLIAMLVISIKGNAASLPAASLITTVPTDPLNVNAVQISKPPVNKMHFSAEIPSTVSASNAPAALNFYVGTATIPVCSAIVPVPIKTGARVGCSANITGAAGTVLNYAAQFANIRGVSSKTTKTFTLQALKYGDVNGDGAVNLNDLIAVSQFLNGSTKSPADLAAYNLNQNKPFSFQNADTSTIDCLGKASPETLSLQDLAGVAYIVTGGTTLQPPFTSMFNSQQSGCK